MDINPELTTNTEDKKKIDYTYSKHRQACKGTCGYCKQLKQEAALRLENKKEEEAQFAWDEPSIFI